MPKLDIFVAMKSACFASVLALCASAAIASPVFTVAPSYFGGSDQSFTADQLASVGVARVVLNGPFGAGVGSTATGIGWTNFSEFTLGGAPIASTGLNSVSAGYFLWAEFTYGLSLTSGGLGLAGSQYTISSATISFFGEFNDAGSADDSVLNAGNSSVNPSVTRSGDAVLLAVANLLSGEAEIDALGGTSFKPTMTFQLTSEGSEFFVAPDRFFEQALVSFTNPSSGVTPGPQSLYLVTDATVGFARSVPEPSGFALIGLALIATGVASRRRRAA